MDKERFDINTSGTPKIIELDSVLVRRHSTGKFCTPNTGVEIPSRYLRPKQISCHDFCKYGLEQSLETKENCLLSMYKRKKPGQKLGDHVVEGEISSLIKEETVSSRRVLLHGSGSKLKPTLSLPSSMRKYLIGEGDSNSQDFKVMKDLVINEGRDLISRRKNRSVRSKESRSSSKSENNVWMPPSRNVDKSHYLNGGGSCSSDTKTIRKPKLELSRNVERGIGQNNKNRTLGFVNGAREVKRARHGQSRHYSKQFYPSSTKPNPRYSESGVHTSRSCKNGVRGTQRGIHISRSCTSTLTSLSTSSAASAEQREETDIGNQRSCSGKESKNRRKESGATNSKDKRHSKGKQGFQRGHVVDLQSEDSHPKRLEFKQSVLDDNQSDSLVKENDDDDENSASETNSTMGVLGVLDFEEKDDNNVIERSATIDPLILSLTMENLTCTRSRNRGYKSPPSWPSSPKKKGLRGIKETRVCRSDTCSLTSWSSNSDDDDPSGSEPGDNDNEHQAPSSRMEHVNWSKMGKTLFSEDDEAEVGRKMTFRRGKVLELLLEDCTPRRLKFRRKLLLGDSQDCEGVSSKTRVKEEYNGGQTNADNQMAGSEKVVLKHQDMEGKSRRSLFNNVIEETVSKLVKTKKSKVLALVGAFETVISLQDSKQSVTATAF